MEDKGIWASYRYPVFISYAREDELIASRLEQELEAYDIPRALRGKWTPHGPVPKRIAPIFRDRTGLAAASSLDGHLAEQLEQSAVMIVICSPAARRSEWVDKEIRSFQALGRAERILALIVAGEPNTGSADECFPDALHDIDPAAADARQGVISDGWDQAKLKLVAGVIGINLTELQSKENELLAAKARAARLTALSLAGLSVVAVAMGGYGFWQAATARANLARSEENLALAQQSLSRTFSIITDTRYDNLAGARPLFAELTDQILPVLKEMSARGDAPPDIIALANHRLARAAQLQGRTDEAIDTWRLALDAVKSTIAPTAPDQNAVTSYLLMAGSLAYAEWQIGKIDEATAVVAAAEPVFEMFVLEKAPKDRLYAASRFLSNKATFLRDKKDYSSALSAATKAEEIARYGLKAQPDSYELNRTLMRALNEKSEALKALKNLEASRLASQEGCNRASHLFEQYPANLDVGADQVWCLIQTSLGSHDSGETALAILLRAEKIGLPLLALDPEHRQLGRMMTALNDLIAQSYDESGEPAKALEYSERNILFWADILKRGGAIGDAGIARIHTFQRYLARVYQLPPQEGREKLEKVLAGYSVGASRPSPDVVASIISMLAAGALAEGVKMANKSPDWKSALPYLSRAWQFVESAYDFTPSNTYRETAALVCEALFRYGEALHETGDVKASVRSMETLAIKCAPQLTATPFDFNLRSLLEHGEVLQAKGYVALGRYSEALPLLRRGSSQGLIEATKALSELYDHGWGVERSIPERDRLQNLAKRQSPMIVTIAANTDGVQSPVKLWIYDRPVDFPFKGVDDQFELLRARGVSADPQLAEKFRKLQSGGRQIGVTFPEMVRSATKEPTQSLINKNVYVPVAERVDPSDKFAWALAVVDELAKPGSLTEDDRHHEWYTLLGFAANVRDDLKPSDPKFASVVNEIDKRTRLLLLGATPDLKDLANAAALAQILSQYMGALSRNSDGAWYAKKAIELSRRIDDPKIRNSILIPSLSSYSFYALFTGDPNGALLAATETLKLDPEGHAYTATNQAHALMLLGRNDEARKIYLSQNGQFLPSLGRAWNDAILEDFDLLRKQGLTSPLMAEIERAYKNP